MIQENTHLASKQKRSYINICLILSAFLFTVVLSSCQHSKSVRKGVTDFYMPRTNTTDVEEEAIAGRPRVNDILAFQEKIIRKKNATAQKQQTPRERKVSTRKLITLREQLNTVESNQKVISGRVDTVEEEISVLKKKIADLELKVNRKRKKSNLIAKKSTVQKPRKKKRFVLKSDESIKPQKKSIAKDSKNYDEETFSAAPQKEKKQVKKVASNQKRKKYSLALSDYKKKKFKESIKKLKDVIKSGAKKETISNCNYWIGESYFHLENYASAIKHMKKVTNSIKSPNQDDAQIKIAEANLKLGRIANAKKEYKNLLASFPKSEFIPKARKMLQQL